MADEETKDGQDTAAAAPAAPAIKTSKKERPADETIPGGKYVDAQGNTVNAHGQKIDAKGNVLE